MVAQSRCTFLGCDNFWPRRALLVAVASRTFVDPFQIRPRLRAETFEKKYPMKKRLLSVSFVAAIVGVAAVGHSQPAPSAPPPQAATMRTLASVAKMTMPAFQVKASLCPAFTEPTEGPEDLCKDGKTANGKCGKLSALRSNRCVNEALNSGVRDAVGRPVNYAYFGADDCRVGYYRDIKLVTKLIVHNGGYTAKMNSDLFKCGNPFPTHYTIERDGGIFQLVGEERHTNHANDESRAAIGIEMNIDSVPKPGGGRTSCNSLGGKDDSGRPEAPMTDANVRAACTPTAAQYTSLRNLLAAIQARTAVSQDQDHLLGHCEARLATHGDPRGFDWRELGLSNKDKLAKVKASGRTGTCSNYDLFP